MKMAHNIDIVNNDANWLAWGQLVNHWIRHPDVTRPTTVKQLKDALAGANPLGVVVAGTVQGVDDRPVNLGNYPDDPSDPHTPIQIWLPSARMLDNDIARLNAPGPYPLNSFYDICYVAPVRRNNCTKAELESIMLRRVGEFVTNECL
jgi:hypothetical protein